MTRCRFRGRLKSPVSFYSYAREDEDSHPIEGVSMHIASLAINKNEGRRDFGPGTFPTVSPDGHFLVYTLNGGLMYKAADGSGSEKYATTEGTGELLPRLSPDGRLLAFLSTGSHRGIVVTTFPAADRRWQIAFEGIASFPCWSRSGSKLYFRTSNNELFEVSVATKPEVSFSKPHLMFNGTDAGIIFGAGYDVGPTDDRFLVLADDPENPPVIRVIDNWAREFVRTDHR